MKWSNKSSQSLTPPSHILALSSLQNEIEILNIHLMQEKSQKDVLRAS